MKINISQFFFCHIIKINKRKFVLKTPPSFKFTDETSFAVCMCVNRKAYSKLKRSNLTIVPVHKTAIPRLLIFYVIVVGIATHELSCFAIALGNLLKPYNSKITRQNKCPVTIWYSSMLEWFQNGWDFILFSFACHD